jgi:hypothetical protein
LELNEVLRDISEGSVSPGVDSAKVLKLREENEQLRRQLSSQRHKYQSLAKKHGDEDNEEEEFDHNSFLQGI